MAGRKRPAAVVAVGRWANRRHIQPSTIAQSIESSGSPIDPCGACWRRTRNNAGEARWRFLAGVSHSLCGSDYWVSRRTKIDPGVRAGPFGVGSALWCVVNSRNRKLILASLDRILTFLLLSAAPNSIGRLDWSADFKHKSPNERLTTLICVYHHPAHIGYVPSLTQTQNLPTRSPHPRPRCPPHRHPRRRHPPHPSPHPPSHPNPTTPPTPPPRPPAAPPTRPPPGPRHP